MRIRSKTAVGSIGCAVLLVAVAALLVLWDGGGGPEPLPVSPARPGEIDLRVMSFNVLQGRSSGSAGHWDERKDIVVERITAFGPDLLGTQEVLDFQLDFLKKKLPGYEVVARGRMKEPDADEHAAIFFKASRFEKLDEGHFWLSETPDVPGSKDWFTFRPRMTSWVKLRTRTEPPRTVVFFNCHVSPTSIHAKRESARIIRERIREIAGGGPAILVGDFNTAADTETQRRFLAGAEPDGLRLADAFRALHAQPLPNEGTWHGPMGVRPDRRIDWVLATPHFTPVAAGIDRTARDGRYPSDHCPVTAVLRLGAESRPPAE